MGEYRKRQILVYLLSLDIIFPGVMCKALCMQVSKHHFCVQMLVQQICTAQTYEDFSVCDEFLLII